jgi:hypothetical protein
MYACNDIDDVANASLDAYDAELKNLYALQNAAKETNCYGDLNTISSALHSYEAYANFFHVSFSGVMTKFTFSVPHKLIDGKLTPEAKLIVDVNHNFELLLSAFKRYKSFGFTENPVVQYCAQFKRNYILGYKCH